MMIAYEIRPDQANWKKWSWIEASHPLGLPGLRCPVCGVRSTTGVQYPSVKMADLEELRDTLAGLWPVERAEYNRLIQKVKPVLGPDRPIVPGTHFGAVRGKGKGETGDFSWVNPWTPLLRESVWQTARKKGIDLSGAHADIKFSEPPDHEPLVELEAIPLVSVFTETEMTPCSICGRIGMKVPDDLAIDGKSFNEDIPLQRILELPTVLIVNSVFADFITSSNLSNVNLLPVEVR